MLKLPTQACRFAAACTLVCALTAAQAQEAKKPDAAKKNANVAAIVGGEPITLAEVDAEALADMKLAKQLYDARRAALDDIIMQKVLGEKAAAANMPVQQYINTQIAEKIKPVADADIEAFFNANQGRMRGRTLEQVQGQIRNYLASQRRDSARDDLIEQVKKEANVKIVLEPPRAEVVIAANDPVKGPKDAEITIVEYSDFQ